MPVPPASQLRPGVSVSIVLKADQPTGKLTPGVIADVLTRGNHPRGIKVRLTTGQIGRVQSIGTGSAVAEAVPFSRDDEGHTSNIQKGRYRRPRKNRRAAQPAGIEGEMPSGEGLSLLDYVRTPSSRARTTNARTQDQDPNTVQDSQEHLDSQKQLQAEFSNLDSALIAAILSDYTNTSEARVVLHSLG
ncbi:MAG: hypothetical protein Q9160_008766 [Pyrenula sp. 1 TL-2023]